MKYLGYFSKLIGMRSKLSKDGEIATAFCSFLRFNAFIHTIMSHDKM